MKQLHFFHFISIHDCISYFIQDTKGQRNIKIILLQMILYPVALFQQKIVITNKILKYYIYPLNFAFEFHLYILLCHL